MFGLMLSNFVSYRGVVGTARVWITWCTPARRHNTRLRLGCAVQHMWLALPAIDASIMNNKYYYIRATAIESTLLQNWVQLGDKSVCCCVFSLLRCSEVNDQHRKIHTIRMHPIREEKMPLKTRCSKYDRFNQRWKKAKRHIQRCREAHDSEMKYD